ncbi:hypothetical protein FZEAL_9909 [Fusarium zealandicum]|uniref:Uncharacterized protein n=1 Tax=Fusarium zealandicum TaxID=1053134 RepID=A0A8H4U7R8_9HYPO|nr:hypothetical protein FZEAL_9909 [Fusarium zealandicum]
MKLISRVSFTSILSAKDNLEAYVTIPPPTFSHPSFNTTCSPRDIDTVSARSLIANPRSSLSGLDDPAPCKLCKPQPLQTRSPNSSPVDSGQGPPSTISCVLFVGGFGAAQLSRMPWFSQCPLHDPAQASPRPHFSFRTRAAKLPQGHRRTRPSLASQGSTKETAIIAALRLLGAQSSRNCRTVLRWPPTPYCEACSNLAATYVSCSAPTGRRTAMRISTALCFTWGIALPRLQAPSSHLSAASFC